MVKVAETVETVKVMEKAETVVGLITEDVLWHVL